MQYVTLYCAGCGEPVCEARHGEMISSSCSCGALAPVLYHDGVVHPPSSFIDALLNFDAPPPHLECFLGYSGRIGFLRQRLVTLLHAVGSTSQADCKEGKCRQAYRQGKGDWSERGARLERAARIAEIGEP